MIGGGVGIGVGLAGGGVGLRVCAGGLVAGAGGGFTWAGAPRMQTEKQAVANTELLKSAPSRIRRAVNPRN